VLLFTHVCDAQLSLQLFKLLVLRFQIRVVIKSWLLLIDVYFAVLIVMGLFVMVNR